MHACGLMMTVKRCDWMMMHACMQVRAEIASSVADMYYGVNRFDEAEVRCFCPCCFRLRSFALACMATDWIYKVSTYNEFPSRDHHRLLSHNTS